MSKDSMSKDAFKNLLVKCLSSPDEFKANITAVREEVLKPNIENIKLYLDTVLTIIADKKASPTSRFYALFSLKMTTEHSNTVLTSQLFSRSSSLKVLQEQATFDKNKNFPERGSTFFNSKPSDPEKTTGSKYLAVLLEMIKYWNIKYGQTDEKKKDNPPRDLFRKLAESQKVPFPEKFQFYKPQQQTGQTAQAGQAGQTGQQGASQISKAQTTTNQPTQKQPTVDSKAPAGGKNAEMVKTAKDRLNAITHLKAELKQTYESNQEALEADVLQFYYDDLAALSKDLGEKMEYFFTNPSPDSESIVHDMITQNDQVGMLLEDFKSYSSKKVEWEEHRGKVLTIFQINENAGTPDTKTPMDKQQQDQAKLTVSDQKTLNDRKPPKLSDSEKMLKAEEEKNFSPGASGKNKNASPNVGGKIEIDRAVSHFVPSKEAEKRIFQHPEEPDEAETLKVEARKKVAKLVTSNSSDLYEDADYPDPKEEQKAKVEESERQKREKEKEELRLKEVKAKEEQGLKEEKAKEEQRIKEEKVKEELLLKLKKDKEELGIKEEKAKEELKLKEEKAKEEQRLKEEETKKEQRLKEEKAKEELRLKEEKAKEEQRLKEDKANEDQRLKEQKAKEELRIKEEKAKEEQKQKETNEKLQKEQSLKTSVTGSDQKQAMSSSDRKKDIKTASGVEQTTLTKNQSSDGSNPKITKASTLQSPEYNKPLVQSVLMKVDDTGPKETNQQQKPKGMVQSFKLDQSTVAQKFAGDLKVMEQSIRGTKERKTDLEMIKQGIKQSFIIRNRKPPNYKELVDQELLKNLEEQLQNLKKERLTVSSDENVLKPQSLTQSTTQAKAGDTEAVKKLTAENTELRQKTDKLQKDCDKYQQDIKTLTSKIEELEQKMKQMQVSSQGGQKKDPETNKETERLKLENRELQERVKKLEQQLNEAQQQQKQQQQQKRQQQQQNLSPDRSGDELAHSVHEAQELRDQMKEITDQNQWLQDTVNELKKKNKDLHEKLVELEDLQNSVGHTRSEALQQSQQNGATAKTESHARQQDSMGTESPAGPKTNIFRGKSQEPIQSGKPLTRNIFGMARGLLASEGFDEYSNNANLRTSPQNPSVKTASKQEIFNANGRNLMVHDLEVDSTTQQSNLAKKPNIFQKSEFNSKDPRFSQLSRSPDDRVFSSPGNYLHDSHYNNSDSKYHGHIGSESENERDALEIRGDQVISEIFVLKELKIRLGVAESGSSLQQFKNCCLKPKSLLFENDSIQIGVTASLVQDYASSKNLVKLMMYYGNKLDDDITNFRVSLTEGLNLNVIAKPQSVESIIAAGKQVKQQLLISFTTVPFSCLQLNCEGLFGGSYSLFSFPLPNLLVKFMEFKYIEIDEFGEKWSYLEDSLLKTEPILLDTTMIKSAYDFKKYFSYLIDLKPKDEYEFVQGKKGIKFGGLVELETPNVEYLLKVNVLPSNEVVFQVATQRQHHVTARYLLQTLAFLFRR